MSGREVEVDVSAEQERGYPVVVEQARSPHDTGVYRPRTYLFLDDLHVGRLDGLRRVTGTVEHATSGPVLAPEAPWEGLGLIGRNCILWDADESRFKCWYPAYDPTLPDAPVGAKRRWAYAESRDGLSWERPNLGLTEFAGSTANNLLRLEGVGESAAVLWSVAKDPRDPDPARRYKAIGLDRHPRRPGELTWTGPEGEDEWYRSHGRHLACGVYVAYSADGLTWRQREGWAGSGALITDNTILHGYDSPTHRWVLWQRPRIMPKHRVIGVSFSTDFDDWTFPECVLAPDEHDPPGTQFDQLSTVTASDGGFVGLLGASAALRSDRGVSGANLTRRVMSVVPQLVYSRDARRWERVDREPFIRPQRPLAWDDGCIIPFNPQVVGDEVFIFYYGKNAGHIWGEPTTDGTRVTRSAFGLVKVRRDRWVALVPESPIGGVAEGTLTTGLIAFARPELRLNADAAGGSIAVELVDCQSGEAVPGYRFADCDPFTGDSLDHPVNWRGRRDLSPIIGTARRQPQVGRGLVIRVRLRGDARLYGLAC